MLQRSHSSQKSRQEIQSFSLPEHGSFLAIAQTSGQIRRQQTFLTNFKSEHFRSKQNRFDKLNFASGFESEFRLWLRSGFCQVSKLFVDWIARMFLPLLPQHLLQLGQSQRRVLNFQFGQSDLFEVLEGGLHTLLRMSVHFRCVVVNAEK